MPAGHPATNFITILLIAITVIFYAFALVSPFLFRKTVFDLDPERAIKGLRVSVAFLLLGLISGLATLYTYDRTSVSKLLCILPAGIAIIAFLYIVQSIQINRYRNKDTFRKSR